MAQVVASGQPFVATCTQVVDVEVYEVYEVSCRQSCRSTEGQLSVFVLSGPEQGAEVHLIRSLLSYALAQKQPVIPEA
jgi:hypothetical protein